MSKGGSAPQPVDPYEQAAAQYGLATGTAEFNAGLNRTNSTNPLGSSYWTSTTPDSSSSPPAAGAPPATSTGSMGFSPNPLSAGGLTGEYPGAYFAGSPSAGNIPAASNGPPTYTQTTQLAPWAQSELEQPLDTQGLPGMPGGPSIQQNLQDTQNAIYNQQMGYIQPQEQLANEQLQSQLANSGATVGSAAYNNAEATQNRANTFTNQQAIDQAITGGEQEQSNLFGLGTQALQNQITARNVPINEFNSLNGGSAANATAQTPDISGAFNQQYQGALAGYNANNAASNADTSAAGSLIGSYLMYLALA